MKRSARLVHLSPLVLTAAALARPGDPLLDYWIYNRTGPTTRYGTTDCSGMCSVPPPARRSGCAGCLPRPAGGWASAALA